MGYPSFHAGGTKSVDQPLREDEPRCAEGQSVELALFRANGNASLSPNFLVQRVATQELL